MMQSTCYLTSTGVDEGDFHFAADRLEVSVPTAFRQVGHVQFAADEQVAFENLTHLPKANSIHLEITNEILNKAETCIVRVFAHKEFLVGGSHVAMDVVPGLVARHEQRVLLLDVCVVRVTVGLHPAQKVVLDRQVVRFAARNR